MRRNFAEILKSAKIDYVNEYKKLYKMLFVEDSEITVFGEKRAPYDIFDESFPEYRFAGTCLSLREFDKVKEIYFPDSDENITFDDLLSLMEYLYNLLDGYPTEDEWGSKSYIPLDINFGIRHLCRLAEAIGYEFIYQYSSSGSNILVEKDAVVTAVAESDLIPEEISYRLITYNHHSMRGNLEDKKAIILQLANLLEGKQKDLCQINSGFKKDLFYLFNNFNIRHNNCDRRSNDYKPAIANMDKEKLENWYDETYQMCLLAFMELEQADRKPKFDAIKDEIEKK